MLSLPSLFSLPAIFKTQVHGTIKIRPVPKIDVEVIKERRGRTLKHLLKLNHANYSILYHTLQFHNHLPHILGSAYLFGSTTEHLERIYDKEAAELEKWRDSPGEVSKHDWADYLGHREYQRAFEDFFEDQLVEHNYNWRRVVDQYLFEEKPALVHSLVSGLAHPLIHLGYAVELNSKEVAMEALGLAATCYGFMHKYSADPAYTKPPSGGSASLLEILEKVRCDKRFDGLFDGPDSGGMERLFQEHEELVLEYWNAWNVKRPEEQFRESQSAATSLLSATVTLDHPSYDFFLVHVLTSSHAIRIILPSIPGSYHLSLVRQWWLFALAAYVTQSRPYLDRDRVFNYDLHGRGWDWIDNMAIHSKWAYDAHFVKALRAMKEAARTWGDTGDFQLKAAVRLVDGFNGWFDANRTL